MKTCSISLIAGVLAAISLTCAAQDVPSLRLTAPSPQPGEAAGSSPSSVAVGSGKIALGAWNGVNAAGIPTGNVRIFDERTGAFRFSLAPSDGGPGDLFGASVSISGNMIAIGAPKHTHNGQTAAGAVYVFDLNTRRVVQKLETPSFLTGEHWGQSVVIEDNRVIIGAPDANFSAGISSGAVAVWTLGESNYSRVILAPGAAAGDMFGSSVAVEGDLLAVGAPGQDRGGIADAGSVYLYDVSTGIHLSTPAPDVSEVGDGLGHSVSLDRHYLAAGAPGARSSEGKTCVWTATTPSAVSLLSTVRGVAGESLGHSVSLHGGMLAIGCPGRFLGGIAVGAVRIMDRNASRTLYEVQPTSLRENDAFGRSVAITGSTLTVSAMGDDTRVTEGGTVWKCGPVAVPSDALFDNLFMLSGDFASGTAGAQNGSVVEAVESWGQSAYIARLTGAGSTGGRNLGLWSDVNPGRLMTLVKQTGVPEFGVRYTGMSGLINQYAGGHLYAFATRAGFGITAANARLFGRQDRSTGIFTPMITAGGFVSGGAQVQSIGAARINNGRDFAMLGLTLKRGSGSPVVTSASDSAGSVWESGVLLGLRREGVSVSPLGTPYAQIPSALAMCGDRSFTISTAQLGGAGVTTANNVFVDQNTAVVARKGDLAPDAFGAPIGVFHSFTAACGDNPGTVFKGTLAAMAGVSPSTNEGLWSNRTGSLRLILRKGASAPLVGGGAVIRRIVKFGMNLAGDLVIHAQLGGAGVTSANDQIIYLNSTGAAEPGDFSILLREGNVAPGGKGARIGSILALDFTSIPTFHNSGYGILASLRTGNGVSAANNLVWLVGRADPGSLAPAAARSCDIVLRKGALVKVGSGMTTVTGFGPGTRLTDATGTLNSGLGHALERNFAGSTLKVQFANRRQAVVGMRR